MANVQLESNEDLDNEIREESRPLELGTSKVITSDELVNELEDSAPTELDLCDVDPIIKNQRFICVSFVEPQFETLEKQENLITHEFLRRYLADHSAEVVRTMCRDYNLDEQEALLRYNLMPNPDTDPEAFADQEKWDEMKKKHMREEDNHLFKHSVSDLLLEYHRYKDDNIVELRSMVNEKYPDECFDRGLKFRGAFSSQTKAQKFAKELFKKDKISNIYVVQGFHWIPFNPPQDFIKSQKTPDRRLNDLLWGYRKQQAFAEQFFNERKEELIKDKVRKPAAANKVAGQRRKAHGPIPNINE